MYLSLNKEIERNKEVKPSLLPNERSQLIKFIADAKSFGQGDL